MRLQARFAASCIGAQATGDNGAAALQRFDRATRVQGAPGQAELFIYLCMYLFMCVIIYCEPPPTPPPTPCTRMIIPFKMHPSDLYLYG